MVRLAASGNLDYDNIVPTSPPPIYKYSFLLDRARYLVSNAQQFENTMLSSLEKLDQENYNYFKAQQNIKLEKSNLKLQGLRLIESSDSKKQSQLQYDKVEDINQHYIYLIDKGISNWEYAALGSQIGAGVAFAVGAFAADLRSSTAEIANATGHAIQTAATVFSTKASWDRRKKEWEFQRDISKYDMDISKIGIDIAQDRFNIVKQEKAISELRLGFVNDNVEFLNNKFGNKELYGWMSKNMTKLYHNQLNMAISIAKSAQRALEFERQTSLDFIGYEYWNPERKGLLGAEKLLSDINEMEQYRLTSATRKKEITKTISLTGTAPAEFQQFRKTGVLQFETMQSWFDRDFPGHYMRLIKDVKISVYALIPPTEGIHATLMNSGISRVMTGPPFEEPSIVYRLPESISLSQTMNATGLFELRPDANMLLPFEGSGVETTWTLEMPKGANRFDYSSIADILFTIRYTAKEDRSYRQKVLDDMGQDEMGYIKTSSNRYFSIANEFPDQWYYFHNPYLGLESENYCYPMDSTYEALENNSSPLKEYNMVIDLQGNDFVPNEDNKKIKKITFAIQTDDDLYWEEDFKIPLKVKFLPKRGFESDIVNFQIEDVFDTSDDFNGKKPFGKWILQLDYTDPSNSLLFPKVGVTLPDISWLKDIVMVVEYKADIHYNR